MSCSSVLLRVGVAIAVLAAGQQVLASPSTPPAGVPADARIDNSDGAGPAELTFTSEALGRPTTSLVWRPEAAPENKPLPVLYFLHGEVSPGASARPLLDAARLGELADAGQFVVVAPDAGTQAWCSTCAWVDGRGDGTTPAETHLYDELLPSVEELVRVRRHARDRAIAGSGMGGTGALIQAFRHPDRFAFAGGLSATLDVTSPMAPATDVAALASQGYTAAAAEPVLRSVNPATIAVNALGTELDVVVSHGDGCAQLAGLGCATADPATAPIETAARRVAQGVTSSWTELTLGHTWVPFAGARFASDADVLRTYYLPRIRAAFKRAAPAPWRASYQTIDSAFSAWGWDVNATRPNTEFLRLLGMRTDGRDVIVSGSGSVVLTTPPAFEPGRSYERVVTREPNSEDPADAQLGIAPLDVTTEVVTADGDGRIALGTITVGPERTVDERQVLFERGQFPLSRVRVEVRDLDDEVVLNTTGPVVRPLHHDLATLPEPFRSWNVSLSKQTVPYANEANSDQVLYLTFNSPTLYNRRVGTQVYVPDAYLRTTERFPVVYDVHGTGYGSQVLNLEMDQLLDRIGFLVVAPDFEMSDDVSTFCRNCYWVDAHNPRHPADETPGYQQEAELDGNRPFDIDGDSHLQKDLMPLIEALFDARTDRGGRGIIGNSMGGSGARIQAYKHPDRYSYIGSISGIVDFAENDEPASPPATWAGYMGLQRYPSSYTHEALYRNVSALHLAPHVVGQHLETFGSVGDGCVTGGVWCGRDAAQMQTEQNLRRNNDIYGPRQDALGLAHLTAEYHGIHYYPDGVVFREYYLDRINRHFHAPPPEPETFGYKTADRSFGIWGYEVAVERPNIEFLNLLDATRDGSRFTLAGTGTVAVSTPPAFTPGATFSVLLTRDGVAAERLVKTADATGRIGLELALGADRLVDERDEAVAAGEFRFPHTRVEITAA